MSHITAFHQGLHCLLEGNSFKDRGASFCINFDQQPFEEKKIIIKKDCSVLVAIHQKWKGLRLIAQDSCMIH